MTTGLVRRRRGSIAVIAALSMTMLIATAALSLDIANLIRERTRLQTAVDAAVLAGGQDLPSTAAASSTALSYLSSYYGEDGTGVSFTYDATATHMTMTKTKQVSTFFLPVIGLTSVMISATAKGEHAGVGGAFDRALFAGSATSTLSLNGTGLTIKGSVHSNQNLVFNGSPITVTKTAEAVGNISTLSSNYTAGALQAHAPSVSMPDLSDSVASAAAAANQVYNSNVALTASSFTKAPMYVKGSVTTSGTGFNATGAIMADSSITIGGSGTLMTGNNQVAFYSKNGDVVINTSNVTINGVLYAPNGRVVFNGGNITINGSVVANQILLNGSGITINRDDYPVTSLAGRHVKLVQ